MHQSQNHKKKDEKTRKSGLLRHIKQITSSIDEIGQKTYLYEKGKPASNQWMDDHCDGMWIKPQFNGIDQSSKELKKFKDDLDSLGHTIEYYNKNPGKIIEAGHSQLAQMAVDKLGYDNVKNMILKKMGTNAVLAALPVKAGMAAKFATIGKTGFSAAGYLETAEKLAAMLKTYHAKELLHGLKFMANESQELLGKLMQVWKEKPDAVMTELMSLNSEIDPCLSARKCQLVPYNSNDKTQLRKGLGCCPGQTAHHVTPDSAAKNAGCRNYKYEHAPTICLEGQDNTYGSHGSVHLNLDK